MYISYALLVTALCVVLYLCSQTASELQSGRAGSLSRETSEFCDYVVPVVRRAVSARFAEFVTSTEDNRRRPLPSAFFAPTSGQHLGDD